MNLTTDELSQMSGIPKGTLDKILSGITKDPKLETLKALSRVFNCSLDEFDDREIPIYDDLSEKKYDNSNESLVLRKYKNLDEKGKHVINVMLEMEYDRCQSEEQAITKENDNLLDISIFPDEIKDSILHSKQVIEYSRNQPKNENIAKKTLLAG